MSPHVRGVIAGALVTAFCVSVPALGSTVVRSGLSSSAATSVSITMKNRAFRASSRTVAAGRITFVVQNAGTMDHEFVVIKSNAAPGALPMRGAQARETGAKGEIEEFAPGRTKKLTLTLAPGKYILLCNLPGHYKRGQFIGLTVTPTVTPPKTTNVTVSMFEMGFKLSQTTVPHGTVSFDVRNDGKLPHDFSFGSRGGGTRLLDPGESTTFTVEFATAGKYIYICTVEGHAEGGMIGTLTVE